MGLNRVGRLASIAVLAVALGPGAAGGSTLRVTTTAAHVGAFGLEVELGPGCGAPDTVDLAPPPGGLSGTHRACDVLRVGGLEVAFEAELRAGSSVALGEGFTVAAGAELTVVLDAALKPRWVHARDSAPEAEASYAAGFYLRLDDLPLSSGDRIEHFRALSAAGEIAFRLWIGYSDTLGRHTLALEARRDDGGYDQTPNGQEVPLPPGWNRIEFEWAADSAGGHLRLAVNGQPAAGLEGLSNGGSSVDEILWGAVAGVQGSPTGSLQLDDFSSRR